jgi:hypothetical protein
MNMADAVDDKGRSDDRRAKPTKRDVLAPKSARPKRKAEPPTLTDDLTGKFLRVGNKLYRTSDDTKPIVRLEPDRLKTSNIDALPDIVRIAKANGWTAIRINGGDQFKKAAYLAASAQGLAVENYTPSKLVRAEADRLKSRLAAREERRQAKQPQPASRQQTDGASDLKALSERFLRQTHKENARDPDLRRAQSLVAQAIAIGRTKYPDDPLKASKEVEAKRREVAQRLARGDKIAVIQIRTEQAKAVRELSQDQSLNREGRTR